MAAALALVPLASACAARRTPETRADPERPTVGIYAARVRDPDGGVRRFRLLLYAALPDRIHGEVLSPLGTPQAILDGGAGRLALTFAEDRESFTGEARRDLLARVLGVNLDLGAIVRGLLLGESLEQGCRIRRVGGPLPGLPDAISFESDSRGLELTLKRRRPLETDPATLGTGEPPAGTRVRPLDDLDERAWGARNGAAGREAPGP